MNADGSGLHPVTHTVSSSTYRAMAMPAESLKSHDDVYPCYLPDGRMLVFVSTRYPGMAPDNRLRTTNLYVVNVDGSGFTASPRNGLPRTRPRLTRFPAESCTPAGGGRQRSGWVTVRSETQFFQVLPSIRTPRINRCLFLVQRSTESMRRAFLA